MAAGAMATAVGTAVLLCYILSKRLSSGSDDGGDRSGDLSKTRSGRRKISRRPVQAPATWLETLTTLSETLRFTYSETLGKWPIGDLAFGINYLMRRQDNQQVASVYAGNGCVQLKGPEMLSELYGLLRLLTLCMFFSKKPFPVFLDLAGFLQDDVLLQKPKAGLLKPAFTIIHDKGSKCFLLLIRGTHSIKDTLTAVTGAVVPFHHSVLHDGGISNLVLGYAHCGMVAAARWIAKLATPCLVKALTQYPDHKVKIVGHSLGGGTAALLTYIIREQKEFSSSTCVTFAPAACMTWDLAESGKHFITTIINGADLVPTFSTTSIDDLRSEVTASSWLNDLRDQVEHTRVLNVVYRSATALGSHLPSMASAKARVAGAGALLRPVSSSTEVVMKRAQNVAQAVVRARTSFSSWSCMGPRRRPVVAPLSCNLDESSEASIVCEASEGLITEIPMEDPIQTSRSGHDDYIEEDEPLISDDRAINSSVMEEYVTEGELWYELEKELQRQERKDDIEAQKEEAAAAKEITEEEENIVMNTTADTNTNTSEISQRFYPPGKIMHIVYIPSAATADDTAIVNIDQEDETIEGSVGLYETPRELYSKIRLSRTMINDHYMPMYKKMMELLIKQLERDDDDVLTC